MRENTPAANAAPVQPAQNKNERDRKNNTPGCLNWRVVDIIVAAVLGVTCGLIFWVWNSVGYAWTTTMDALTPGLGGIAIGIWLLGGTVGGLVIRKPGAALFVEVLAAVVSATSGASAPSTPAWPRAWAPS